MGCFSYICPSCKTNIRSGEKVHIRHIRHGINVEKDESEGAYDNYGGTKGVSGKRYNTGYNDLTPGDGSRWDSEFHLFDSIEADLRILPNGKPGDWNAFLLDLGVLVDSENGCSRARKITEQEYDLWNGLKPYPIEARSGSSVYHMVCWKKLSDEEKNKNIVSPLDPMQGCGKPRKKFLA